MTTPSVQGFGLARDGVPTVATAAVRDARFPTPPNGFKVFDIETGAFERWTGATWTTDLVTYGTNASLFGYLPSASAAANGTAFQAAIDATPDHGVLILPPGAYTQSGAPTLNSRTDVTVEAYGATITLSGVGSYGLKLAGTNTRCRIKGLTVFGSGVLSDGHRGIATATDPAVAGGSDMRIRDCTVGDCVVGIYLALTSAGDWTNVSMSHCTVLRSVGTASGQGYGIVYSGMIGGDITDCYVDQCQRHAVYLSVCTGISVKGGTIRRNRNGVATGGQFGGLEIARCRNVTALGTHFDANEDGACDIEPDDAGQPDSDNIVLDSCVFYNSTHWDIRIGSQGPSTAAELRGVLLKNCTFIRPTGATNANNSIRVEHGLTVQLKGCHWYAVNGYTVSVAMIYLVGVQSAIYTQDVEIDDCTVIASANSGGGAVQLVLIGTTLCTASQRIAIRRNTCRFSGTSSFNKLVTYNVTRTSTTIEVYGNNLPDTENTVGIPEPIRAASVSADRGDANVTLVAATDAPIQRFATTLTGNKTVTLPTAGVYNGLRYRIVRTGLGAFTLDVGGLKTIASATAAFVDVEHDGTAFRLTGYGAL